MTEVAVKRRWMPIALGLSLAVNLAVVAAISGAALRHKNYNKGPHHAGKGGVIFMQALPRETRREIRDILRVEGRNTDANPADMLGFLRDVPFDAEAAAGVLKAQNEVWLKRTQAATGVWLTVVSEMSVVERDAYADRLQELLEKREEGRKQKAEKQKN